METKPANLMIPSGTIMEFCQATAPVGWTQITPPQAIQKGLKQTIYASKN
jgi:hypothetical protein